MVLMEWWLTLSLLLKPISILDTAQLMGRLGHPQTSLLATEVRLCQAANTPGNLLTNEEHLEGIL